MTERTVWVDLNECYLCATCAADLDPSYVREVDVADGVALPPCAECGARL
jgi:hypothetical protein